MFNVYLTYDLKPENRKKALNSAFYAVLFQSALSLVFIFFFGYSANILVYFELPAFLILGYLTKLDKPKASFLLLSLFIIDRIYIFVMLVSTTFQSPSVSGSILFNPTNVSWLVFLT